jgi:SAM-dependent methyltransferase
MPLTLPSARLLDVGCGSGQFLARMHGLGWEVVGVEPDPAAVHTARATYGLPVVQGTLESPQKDIGEFDAVTLLHVFEHVPDPRETLHAAWRVLRPGGRLLIVTPNGRGLGSRVFGSAWIGWDPPRHLHVFTVAALRRLLAEAGFALERTCTTGRNARWTWDASAEVRSTGRCRCVDRPQGTAASRWGGRLARLTENLMPGRSGLGEELVAIGVKPPGDMLRASPAHSAAR